MPAKIDGYRAVDTICIPAGHYRAEEGSEHFLFMVYGPRRQGDNRGLNQGQPGRAPFLTPFPGSRKNLKPAGWDISHMR